MTRQAEVRFGERLTWGGEVVRALFTPRLRRVESTRLL